MFFKKKERFEPYYKPKKSYYKKRVIKEDSPYLKWLQREFDKVNPVSDCAHLLFNGGICNECK